MPSAAKPRRGRPPTPGLADQRREQILDAATDLFARHGFDCADLQHAADALGLAKGTLYRYFPTKETIFHAAIDRIVGQLNAAVEAARLPAADPLDQIAAAIEAYLRFFAEHPSYVELLIQDRAGFRGRRTPIYFEHRESRRARWHKFYAGLIAAGRLRDIPPRRITAVLGSLVYGAMLTTYIAGSRPDPRRQAREILDIVFHGILTPQESNQMRSVLAPARSSVRRTRRSPA